MFLRLYLLAVVTAVSVVYVAVNPCWYSILLFLVVLGFGIYRGIYYGYWFGVFVKAMAQEGEES